MFIKWFFKRQEAYCREEGLPDQIVGVVNPAIETIGIILYPIKEMFAYLIKIPLFFVMAIRYAVEAHKYFKEYGENSYFEPSKEWIKKYNDLADCYKLGFSSFTIPDRMINKTRKK